MYEGVEGGASSLTSFDNGQKLRLSHQMESEVWFVLLLLAVLRVLDGFLDN